MKWGAVRGRVAVEEGVGGRKKPERETVPGGCAPASNAIDLPGDSGAWLAVDRCGELSCGEYFDRNCGRGDSDRGVRLAGHGDRGRAGIGRIRRGISGHCYRRGIRDGIGCGVKSVCTNGSNCRIAACCAVHLPGYRCICGPRNRIEELLRLAGTYRRGGGCDHDSNLRNRSTTATTSSKVQENRKAGNQKKCRAHKKPQSGAGTFTLAQRNCPTQKFQYGDSRTL